MSNVLDPGEKISFSKFTYVWIPALKMNNTVSSLYSMNEFGEGYFTVGYHLFKHLGMFDDIDMPKFFDSAKSIRLK